MSEKDTHISEEYNHQNKYSDEQNRELESANRKLETAKKHNKQPNDYSYLNSSTEESIRADWDRLYPIYAAIRALPAHKYDINRAKKWYPLFRRHVNYGPDCVMREQTRCEYGLLMQPHELLCIARALRKDHSEIHVIELNPKDVALAFIPKKDRADYDWTDFNKMMEGYGYDENGIMLCDPSVSQSQEVRQDHTYLIYL